MTTEQLTAQLEHNTAAREARARDLLGAPSVVISNIPANAKRGAGSTNQPSNALSQSQYAALQDRLASTLGNRQAAQSVWQGTTPERSTTADFHSRAAEALDYLDSVLNGRASPLGQSQPAQMSYPTTPHLAGLFMDKPTVDRVMTSKAYTSKTNPLNSFATQAAKSFYGATYADNKPDTPTRQTVAEEPARAAAAAAAVQKETERIQTEHERHARAMQNARTQSEQAQATRTAKQTALNELAPAKTIEPHKLDTLGENAIPKAMGEQDVGLLGTKAEASIAKDRLGDAWGVNAPTTAALAARARSNAEKAVTQISMGEGAAGRSTGYNDFQDLASALSKSGQHGDVSVSNLTDYGTVRGSQQTNMLGDDPAFAPDAFKNTSWDNKTQSGTGSSASSRVICTELVRQGLMDGKLQLLDIAFTLRHLSPVTVRGYHVWAVPYVKLMKRSQLATHLIEPFARWRAEEIAHQMGERERANWKGKCVRWMGEPLCWALGVAVKWFATNTKDPGFPGP